MNPKTKLFIKAEINDDSAYKEAIDYSINLTKKQSSLTKIILVANSMNSMKWLQRLYGDKEVSQMKKGYILSNGVEIKIESIFSLKKKSIQQNSIIITMGIDGKGVFEIDENLYNGVIIAIPWTIQGLGKWLSSNNPIDIRSGNHYMEETVELDCILKTALDTLTNLINLSTGLTHQSDEEIAKTYILTLYKLHSELDTDKILGYLTSQKQWRYEDAKQFTGYIEKLQKGQHFKGGSRDDITLNHYYSLWKEKCR